MLPCQPCGAEINTPKEGEKVNCMPQPSHLPAELVGCRALNSFRLLRGGRPISEGSGSQHQSYKNAPVRFRERRKMQKKQQNKKTIKLLEIHFLLVPLL